MAYACMCILNLHFKNTQLNVRKTGKTGVRYKMATVVLLPEKVQEALHFTK